MRAAGDCCTEHWDSVGASVWGDLGHSCGSYEPSRAFINSSLQGCSPEHACWTGGMQRQGRRSSIRGTADGLGKKPQWLDVKGSQLWNGREKFTGRPKKADFHLQNVPKKVCYFHLLWNLPTNTQKIAKIMDVWQLIQNPSDLDPL